LYNITRIITQDVSVVKKRLKAQMNILRVVITIE